MELAPVVNYDFTVWRGMTLSPTIVTVRDSTSTPVDLSGWTVGYGVQSWPASVILVVIIDPPNGQIEISLTRQETKLIPVGEFPYDIILLTDSGSTAGPILRGTITVKETQAPEFP